MSDEQLVALFEDLRTRFYPGRLRRYRARLVASVPKTIGEGGMGFCDRKRGLLLVVREQERRQVAATLIHEMAHAATTDSHGPRWRDEMRRLLAAGAPVDAIDIELEPVRLSRRLIASVAGDVLRDAPATTARTFVRHVFQEVGGGPATSPADLLRRHPWIARTFDDARREAARLRGDA